MKKFIYFSIKKQTTCICCLSFVWCMSFGQVLRRSLNFPLSWPLLCVTWSTCQIFTRSRYVYGIGYTSCGMSEDFLLNGHRVGREVTYMLSLFQSNMFYLLFIRRSLLCFLYVQVANSYLNASYDRKKHENTEWFRFI